MQFSLGRLILIVWACGTVYALYVFHNVRVDRLTRAGACRANLNLIDRYVGMWERAQFDLDASRGPLTLDLDSDGKIVRSTGLPAGLGIGSLALTELARDPDAFACPESQRRGWQGIQQIHYRWIASPDPVADLGGGTRGAICLQHGTARPPDDRGSWHALVKGWNP